MEQRADNTEGIPGTKGREEIVKLVRKTMLWVLKVNGGVCVEVDKKIIDDDDDSNNDNDNKYIFSTYGIKHYHFNDIFINQW